MVGVLRLKNVTPRLLGSAPNKAALCCHSQKSVSDQCPEDGLAGLPIDGPQALRLRQREAKSRHFGVLGSNSAREFAFHVGARSAFEKTIRQWHNKLPPMVGTSEARRATRAAGREPVAEPTARRCKEVDGRRNVRTRFTSVLPYER